MSRCYYNTSAMVILIVHLFRLITKKQMNKRKKANGYKISLSETAMSGKKHGNVAHGKQIHHIIQPSKHCESKNLATFLAFE